MLWFELDKNLDVITGGGDLRKVIFELIKIAETENWVEDLISAALRENPGNYKLKDLHLTKPSKVDIDDSTLLETPVIVDKVFEIRADYTKLRNLLDNKEFGKADLETLRIILWITNRQEGECLKRFDIENFPIRELYTMNQLWLAGSYGKFGFSIQQQIWIDNGGKPGVFDEETFERFVEKVEWAEKNKVIPDQRAKDGHLPLAFYVACGGLDLMKWWTSIDRYYLDRSVLKIQPPDDKYWYWLIEYFSRSEKKRGVQWWMKQTAEKAKKARSTYLSLLSRTYLV